MSNRRPMLLRSWSWKRPRPGQSVSKKAWECVLRTRNADLHLQHIPFVGICVVGLVKGSPESRAGKPPERRYEVPNVKKKSSSANGSQERHLAAMETSIFAQHMPLVEHCAIIKYEDGDPRLNGWIRMGCLGAAWTLDVKDPDSEMSFRVVDSSLDKAWDAAALLLACDSAPFALDQYLSRKKPQKKA